MLTYTKHNFHISQVSIILWAIALEIYCPCSMHVFFHSCFVTVRDGGASTNWMCPGILLCDTMIHCKKGSTVSSLHVETCYLFREFCNLSQVSHIVDVWLWWLLTISITLVLYITFILDICNRFLNTESRIML